MYRLFVRSLRLLVLVAVLTPALPHPALAWKPSTHVYLAMRALAEIMSEEDYFGNDKEAWTIPIYRVDYETGEILERIGVYEVHPDLKTALQTFKREYLAGVVGPDAYPDIATGQQRIHVDEPVPAHTWFEYLWRMAVENEDAAEPIMSFVAGYITHAAGDMFMHTFVNHYAGGPFQATNSNVARHVILEGYVGKRTYELDPLAADTLGIEGDVYDLMDLDPRIFEFVYRYLCDARRGTELGDEILTEEIPAAPGDVSLLTSFPRHMSSLRQFLEDDVAAYDDEIRAFDQAITNAENDAERAAIALQKQGYIGLHLPRITYATAWIEDIEEGLRAWPSFNHEVMHLLTYKRGNFDRRALDSLITVYQNEHLFDMLGAPDLVGDVAGFIEFYTNAVFPPAWSEALRTMRDDFIDAYLLKPFGFTVEDARRYFFEPDVNFNPVMNAGNDPSNPTAIAVNLNAMNAVLGVDDTNYDDPSIRFNPLTFAPAYNTITMTKLALMAPDEITRLQQDLDCYQNGCRPVQTNVLFDVIASLDTGNEFRKPTHLENKMGFAFCPAYQQLFAQQIGETPLCDIRLAPPAIDPAGGVFDGPVTVTLAHDDPDAELYYTVNFEDAVYPPSDDEGTPLGQRSVAYATPFQLTPPFEGEVRPYVLSVRAFKNPEGGRIYSPSDTINARFTIEAGLPAPAFFPDRTTFTGAVNLTINGPAGATVFYTLNGEPPDYNAARYTAPIPLGVGVHEVQAVAYRIGYTQSPVVGRTITVYDPNTARAADPVFGPVPTGKATFAESVEVTLTAYTEGATVYYTLADGGIAQDPTDASTEYEGPFTLGLGNWQIKAIAYAPGLPPSNIVQIPYEVVEPLGATQTPVIDPNGGTFHNDVLVTLTAATSPPTQGVRIFYSTDGTPPPTNPTQNGNYDDPFVLTRSSLVRAQAIRPFFTDSEVATAAFRLECAPPEITPGSGTYAGAVQVAMTTATEGATIRFTTDGSEPTEASTAYAGPTTLAEGATLKARAFREGYYVSEVTSATLDIRPPSPPLVTRAPVDRSVLVGGTIDLSVGVAGHPRPSIQWQKDGASLPGATTDTLRLAGVRIDDAGAYRAVLTSSQGNVTSAPATLTVLPQPVMPSVVTEPVDLEVTEGETAVLEVTASGVPEPAYLWLRNGIPLPGRLQPALTLTNVQLAHAGAYAVVVRNEAGADTSRAALLTVVTSTDLERLADVPDRFALHQNYPNPFNPATTIRFALPRPEAVEITLYDVAGRRLAILLDRDLPAGTYEVPFDGTGLASGLYFYRIDAGSFSDTRPMVFLK